MVTASGETVAGFLTGGESPRLSAKAETDVVNRCVQHAPAIRSRQ
jgi:hypothetical protein